MKIKFVLLSAMVGVIFSVSAQSNVSSDPFEVQMRIYKASLKNYDLNTATIALYNMQALKPERTDLSDSLALLYFAGERYPQAYLVGEEILKNNPRRSDILELVAVSKQNLGMVKESLADYEKLFAAEKSLFYLYQMATLQYQLKRFGECVASLDQILGNPESEKQKVNIRVQNGSQDVVMRAAAFNVKGICALELNQREVAKENFSKAIQLAPDFVLAKGNFDALNKSEVTPAKPSQTPTKNATPQKH